MSALDQRRNLHIPRPRIKRGNCVTSRAFAPGTMVATGMQLAMIALWRLELGRPRSVAFIPVFHLPHLRKMPRNRRPRERSRSGWRLAVLASRRQHGSAKRRRVASRISAASRSPSLQEDCVGPDRACMNGLAILLIPSVLIVHSPLAIAVNGPRGHLETVARQTAVFLIVPVSLPEFI